MEQVRYLSGEEKQQCRSLWEHAFPDDSRQFVDYYYREKVKDNLIMVLENGQGIASMLHLNPYRIKVKNALWNSFYIVGVATYADHRRKGYMRQLIQRMFQDLYQQGIEFCYLMPASEEIYRPFLFTYIFDQPRWQLKENSGVSSKPLENDAAERAGIWMESFLQQHYQVYAKRDRDYVTLLLNELKSEDGAMELLYWGQQMVGIRGEWGISKKEQRMLLCKEPYCFLQQIPKPAIMARIIYLEGFVNAICLKSDCTDDAISVIMEIEDPWVEENQGSFAWHLTKSSSALEKRTGKRQENQEQVLKITIDQLTKWLFGYSPLEGLVEDYPEWTKQVQVLRGVFLDEIV